MLTNRKILKFILLLLFAGVIVSGCQPGQDTQSDINLDWMITPSPAQVGIASIQIVLKDSLDQPIEGAEIELEGNMSHPGMQPAFAQAVEISPGKYSADFEFTMAGDWFINFTSWVGEKKVAEHQIKINGVRAQES